MSYSILFLFFALFAIVQGLQINFNAPQVANIVKSADTGLLLIKDTAQSHYESMIDDILSQQNEGLLTELSIVIKDPQEMYKVMRPQANFLFNLEVSNDEIQDVCVAQMPGMIANHIHELSSGIYASIDTIISTYWTKSDHYYRKVVLNAINRGLWEQDILDELVNTLQVLNMDITDEIVKVVDDFHMLAKLKQSMVRCQSLFVEIDESSLSEKIWNAILVSFNLSNQQRIEEKGFMGRYLSELKNDIQSEMYSRVYELARSVYEDLAFST